MYLSGLNMCKASADKANKGTAQKWGIFKFMFFLTLYTAEQRER
jgi:hypothetical protein